MGFRENIRYIEEHFADDKYYALRPHLHRDKGEALFVSQAAANTKVRIAQFDGGRDAKYLVVTRDEAAADIAKPLRETIGFARSVQGVELIYDLTDEAMQGKARPFDCDLTGIASRVYAILPVQIERVTVGILANKDSQRCELSFRDAGGVRLAAALPFELTAVGSTGAELARRHCSTWSDGTGQISLGLASASLGRNFTFVFRSLLTGNEERVAGKQR